MDTDSIVMEQKKPHRLELLIDAGERCFKGLKARQMIAQGNALGSTSNKHSKP